MDTLFLLKPNFADAAIEPQERMYYCPSCAAIEGVLSYYPHLRESLEVVYVDFPRPRTAIIELIGEAHQGCPVLIIDNNGRDVKFSKDVKELNGARFINSTEGIMQYLAITYKVGYPHP